MRLQTAIRLYERLAGMAWGLRFTSSRGLAITAKGRGNAYAPGMIFTIEPMVNTGGADIFIDDKNEWEVYTKDGMPSAQWEIMVLVTRGGT